MPSELWYVLSYGEEILPLNGPGRVQIVAPRDPYFTVPRLGDYDVSYQDTTMTLTKTINRTVLLNPFLFYSENLPGTQFAVFETEYGRFKLHPALLNSVLAMHNVYMFERLLDEVIPTIAAATGFMPTDKVEVDFVPRPILRGFGEGYAWFGGGPIQIRYTVLFRRFGEDSDEAFTLVHELVHALTPDRKGAPVGYPTLWTEGVAEAISADVLDKLGYDTWVLARRRLLFSGLSDSLSAYAWNWNWDGLNQTVVANNYATSYFIVDYLVHRFGHSTISSFFARVVSDNLTFAPEDRDRFVSEMANITGNALPILEHPDEYIRTMQDCLSLERQVEAYLAVLSIDPFGEALDYGNITESIRRADSLFDQAAYEEISPLLREANERLKAIGVGVDFLHSLALAELAYVLVVAVLALSHRDSKGRR
jgi:hypothetical protein